MTQFLMQHNINDEKSDVNNFSLELGSRKFVNIKGSNALRPDSLKIKIKSDNIVNIISQADNGSDNVISWSGDHLDNFISQLKNANNTPSPITPNSFFNPSDVTQEQEQFADTLTLHLNKIKENYQSGCQTADQSYLSSIIQTSTSPPPPVSLATVTVGNKLFLFNQNVVDDTNDTNQCLNYGLIDLPGQIRIHGSATGTETIILQSKQSSSMNNTHGNQSNTNKPLPQQLIISNLQHQQSLGNSVPIAVANATVSYDNNSNSYSHAIATDSPDSMTHLLQLNSDNDLSHVQRQSEIDNEHDLLQSMAAAVVAANASGGSGGPGPQAVGFLKTSQGSIIYSRIPDSSESELLSQLTTSTVSRLTSCGLGNNGVGCQITSSNPVTVPGGTVVVAPLPSSLPPLSSSSSSSINIELIPTNHNSVNINNSNQSIMVINETECLSVSSNGNDNSSYGANDSSMNNSTVTTTTHKTAKINPSNKINSISNGVVVDKDDLDIDQQRRLERKRARNRDAARKCRDRKNNLIFNLEQKFAKQTVEKELIRDKLLKSLEEIRKLTDYISKHFPQSQFACFTSFLHDIKIHELTDSADLKDLNLI